MTLHYYLNSFRVQNALKVALASVICVIINAIGDFQYGFFGVINVFILMVMIPETTIKQGIIVFIGSALGVVVAYLFISILTELRLLYLILMVIWLLFCMYQFSNARYAFGALQAGIFSSWLMIAAMNNPADVSSMGIHLILQTGLGIVVALLVYFLLWPPRNETLLKRMLSSVYINFSSRIQDFIDERINATVSGRGANRLTLDSFNGLLAQISRASATSKDPDFPEDAYIKLVARLREIFLKLEILDEALSRKHFFLSEKDVVSTLTKLFRKISEHFNDLGKTLESASGTVSIREDLENDIDYLESRYGVMHDKVGMEFEYYSQVTVFGSLIQVIKDMIREVDAVDSYNNSVVSTATYKSQILRRISRNPSLQKFRKARGFRIDTDRLKLSIKVVFAIVIVVLGDLYFDMPAGIETLITVILVTAAPANIGQAYLKAKLRLAGVIVGGLYSLVVILIVSHITHFSIFLLLLWLGLFLGAYVSSGTERHAYAGFQMGIVLPLILLGTDGPPTSLTVAVQRFVGVIIGGVIAIAVLSLVWPVHPLVRLREELSQALYKSGLVFVALLKPSKKESSDVESQVMTIASDLPTSSTLLKDANYIIGAGDLHSKEYIQVIESLEIIYAELENLRKAVYSDGRSELINKYLDFMTAHYEKMGIIFEKFAQLVKEDAGLIALSQIDVQALVQEVRTERAKFRESGTALQFSSMDLEKFSLIVTGIDGLLLSLANISEALEAIHVNPANHETSELAEEYQG